MRLFASFRRSVEHLLIDASAVYPVCSWTWWAHVMPTHGSTLSPPSRFREDSSRMSGQCRGQERSFLGVEFTQQFAPSLPTAALQQRWNPRLVSWKSKTRHSLRTNGRNPSDTPADRVLSSDHCANFCTRNLDFSWRPWEASACSSPLRMWVTVQPHLSREFTQPCQRTTFLKTWLPNVCLHAWRV